MKGCSNAQSWAKLCPEWAELKYENYSSVSLVPRWPQRVLSSYGPVKSLSRSRMRGPAPGNCVSPLAVELVSKEAKRLVYGHAEVLDVFLCHFAGAEIPKEAQV